jgi:hypothetical protein
VSQDSTKRVLDTIQKLFTAAALAFPGAGVLALLFGLGDRGFWLIVTGILFGGLLLLLRLYRGRYEM